MLGVALAALLCLSALWLLGELVSGVGQFLVAAAALLIGVLRFVLVAGLLSGLTYVLTSAWARPGR